MNKEQYLGNSNIKSFVSWLAENLFSKEKFQHRYLDRRTGNIVSFSSLEDAFLKYSWNGADLAENQKQLETVLFDLKEGVKSQSDGSVRDAAIDVMRWGGVSAYNVAWLKSHTDGLAKYIESVVNMLNQENITTEEFAKTDLRFNSGMSKVYSLLTNNFIIYDSRIAAALGWLVVCYCQEKDLANVPTALKFPWASAKDSPKATNPKNRNPNLLLNKHNFTKIRYGSSYAEWNLKASWILQAVLDRSGENSFTTQGKVLPLRRLEAALFMIGYDLGRGTGEVAQEDREVTQVQRASVEFDNSVEWIDCYTPTRMKKFFYRVGDDDFSFFTINENGNAGPRFSLDLIKFVLRELERQFGDGVFPLSNNAVHVRDEIAAPGLGTVYYQYNRGNPPNTSRLAAILQEFGVLINEVGSGWRLDKPGVEWFWNKFGK